MDDTVLQFRRSLSSARSVNARHPQAGFAFAQSVLDVLRDSPFADQLEAIPFQEIVDRFHPNPDRAGWFVVVDVAEAEVSRIAHSMILPMSW